MFYNQPSYLLLRQIIYIESGPFCCPVEPYREVAGY